MFGLKLFIVIKSADDTTVIGLIADGGKTSTGHRLESCCLQVIIIDPRRRRKREQHTPIHTGLHSGSTSARTSPGLTAAFTAQRRRLRTFMISTSILSSFYTLLNNDPTSELFHCVCNIKASDRFLPVVHAHLLNSPVLRQVGVRFLSPSGASLQLPLPVIEGVA